MEYLMICLAAFFTSFITLYSGFGLGTVLMPVLAVFFPVQAAVASTAVVHLANNIFKVFLVGRHVNRQALLRFTAPAFFSALIGASLLTYASMLPVIASYQLGGSVREITTVKLAIGTLIVFFALLELVPFFSSLSIDRKYLPLGGALSGFFGGLSGNQGAFRSMFLIKAGLSKEEFVGTNVVSAVIVDTGRLFVYGAGFYSASFAHASKMPLLITLATLSAFAGAFIGKRYLKKVTVGTIQNIVGATLLLLGFALAAGVI